jgi:Cysteine-rich secretory protein family
MGPTGRRLCSAPSVPVITPSCLRECRLGTKIVQRRVARFWKQSSGHRTNLLRPNVSEVGVAMAKNKSGRAYWTLVVGAE